MTLTFDDGPDPAVTPQVLHILAQHQVQGTFFCIGEKAAAYPDLCRAIVTQGHTIENHGQRHRHHTALSGFRGWRREIGEAQETLERITGRRPQFYRPLAGLRNPFLDPVLYGFGIRLATWTRRGYDTRCDNAEVVLARLTRNLAAGDILLL
ncbi:polysaccharide deacetylase, partial [mine drainage metagenome]